MPRVDINAEGTLKKIKDEEGASFIITEKGTDHLVKVIAFDSAAPMEGAEVQKYRKARMTLTIEYEDFDKEYGIDIS